VNRAESPLAGLVARLRSWFRAEANRQRLEDEMDAELAHHVECLTADLIRAGHAPAEAARHARLSLGSLLAQKEEMRGSLGLRWWDDLRTDIRYGLRLLARNPAFTAVAAISLSLAIGANTAMFSDASQLLYQRLDVPRASQLRLLGWSGGTVVKNWWGDFDTQGTGITSTCWSMPVLRQLQKRAASVADVFAFKDDTLNGFLHGSQLRVGVEMVSGNYYSGLQIHPVLGRPILPSDDAIAGSGTVAVISQSFWRREFDRSPSVIGQTIVINQLPLTIIGVNPASFTGAARVEQSPDLFVPLSLKPAFDPKTRPSLLDDPNMWWVDVMARLHRGVGEAAATSVLDAALAAAVRSTMIVKPSDSLPHVRLVDGSRGLHQADALEAPVLLLVVLTGFVVLLACANIANLMLARGAERGREMGVRLALGASRTRILRQSLTESLLLAALGGAGGMLLGYFGRNAFPWLMTHFTVATDTASGGADIPFNGRVCFFAVAVTLLTAILFGLAPAAGAARARIAGSLRDGSQSATRRRRGLGGRSLIAVQIALATLLVVGAGLFLRTLHALYAVRIGFRTDHLLLFTIDPPEARYPSGKDIALHERLEQAFAAVPGVTSVSPMTVPLLAQSMASVSFVPEGVSSAGQVSLQSRWQPGDSPYFDSVGTDFFRTLQIPILAGRGFDAQDSASSPRVAVINQTLARKAFPGVNPVGRRFSNGIPSKGYTQIVGICADFHYEDVRSNIPPQYFVPYVQAGKSGAGSMTYAVRTSLAPASIIPSLRNIVAHTDPGIAFYDVRTQQGQLDSTLFPEHMLVALTSGLGVLALVIACVGIYGVMAYAVAQRTGEIGIRLALGAQPSRIRRMILCESFRVALTGTVFGGGAAVALVRVVRSVLYGIQPWDPLSLASAVLLLLTVAVAASWIPARRAARVQPMDALRHE
jgi:predicted permease